MAKKMAAEKVKAAPKDPRARGVQKVRVFPRNANTDAEYDWNDEIEEHCNGIMNGSMEDVLNKILALPNLLNVTTPLHFKYNKWDQYLEIFTEAPETDAQYAARMKKLDAQEAKDLALLAKLATKYKKKVA